LALSVFGLFLFCFCLARGAQATDAQVFGRQCFLGDNFVLFRYCLVQRPFCIFLLFSSIFDRGFPFFFFFSYSPSFNWEFSFLFCLLSFFDRGLSFFLCFLSRARIVVSWDFGSRLVERMDMIYVRALVWFRDKMGCPTLFP